MATKLSISDLADVLAAIKEVTKPYQLGIQLKIGSSDLDEIERNHPRDIDRQKTEVVKYWLRNSPDASWTTLANAVERMGGHARLAGRLREKEPGIMADTAKLQGEEEQIHESPPPLPPGEVELSIFFQGSAASPVDRGVRLNILLLGKMGHGASSLGNRILNGEKFKINNWQCPHTDDESVKITSATQLKEYSIDIYDHTGLFEGASSIDELCIAVPKKLNLVIFVLKRGCDFDESEVEILKSVVSGWQISRISALVLTHCERLSEEERGEMIEQFKKDHPLIAELMGKGILAVGFPDSSHIQPGSPLSQRVEKDKANLRQLIYSCEYKQVAVYTLPQVSLNPRNENRQPPQNKNLEQPENIQPLPNKKFNEQPPQNDPPRNEDRRHLCCSIL
jgi:hypothetical protein